MLLLWPFRLIKSIYSQSGLIRSANTIRNVNVRHKNGGGLSASTRLR